MSDSDELMDELEALWRIRYGQPMPIRGEPQMIVRVMRRVEEKRIAEAAEQLASG